MIHLVINYQQKTTMKRLLLVLIGIICMKTLVAQSVSKELATHMALQYMRNDICNVAPSNYNDLLTRLNSIDTSRTSMFLPTGKYPLYIVQMQEGWVLVASEFVSTPILASAPVGQFPNVTDMPDGLKWLLSYYEDAMLYARDSLPDRADSIRYSWEHTYDSTYLSNRNISSLPSSYEIDSICSFLWNQNGNNDSNWPNCEKVYDKFCPTWFTPTYCDHTYVGCTAVAMGIVMRYYRWPYSALIPDTIDSLANISQEKHLVTYNWSKMPKVIYNSTDVTIVNEIAGLLRDCGYASKMEYKIDGSGASFDNARNALLNNFHYQSVTHQKRKWFIGNWINKLKSEIAANRPVMYAGYNENGGHAFVLYGYTPQNKFKINWGWANETLNMGTFSLDSLTPNGHNYNSGQEAIWGITPNSPSCGSAYTLQQSDVNTNNFEIYRGGAITASNITINNNRSGVIFSGESVTLTSGVTIEAGSHVLIDIKDMHCDNDRDVLSPSDHENRHHGAPRKDDTSIVNNPSSSKILRDGQILILRGDKTYTLTGQEVRQP